MRWRAIETDLITFFRSCGVEILDSSGNAEISCIRRDGEATGVSLTELAKEIGRYDYAR
jgi:hypothetical protein